MARKVPFFKSLLVNGERFFIQRLKQLKRGHQSKMKGQADSESRIFIGGLNYETTKETLLSYFSTFGEILHLDLPKDEVHDGENKGFVIITFKDCQTAEAVLAKEKHKIDGKFVDGRFARPDNFNRGFKSGNPFNQKSRRVFVGGIRDTHSREVLEKFFSQFGTVTDVEIFYDRMTGHCRGFAFIEFYDSSTTDQILQKRYFMIGSDKCEVKPAFCKENGEKNQDWGGYKRRHRGGFQRTKSFSKTSLDHGYGSNASPPPELMSYYDSQLAPFSFYQNTPPPNVIPFELPPLALSSTYYPISPELMFLSPYQHLAAPTALPSPVIFQEFPEVVNYQPYYASF